jgi:hypothetical protein
MQEEVEISGSSIGSGDWTVAVARAAMATVVVVEVTVCCCQRKLPTIQIKGTSPAHTVVVVRNVGVVVDTMLAVDEGTPIKELLQAEYGLRCCHTY